ncbi:MAG: SymE family type I addiction module toxin [Pseudomonadales bacterium]
MANTNSTLEIRSAKAKFPHQRQLKVRKTYYYHQYSDFQPRSNPCPGPVPRVNIKGYWLNQAGFTIGTSLQAKISKGRIVLTAVRSSPSG